MDNKLDKNMNIEQFTEYIRIISQSYNIYIYGAGMYGKIVGEYFQLKSINWCGYIDRDNTLKFVNSKIVYSLNDVENLSNSYVVIALSPIIFCGVIDDIADELRTKGCISQCICCIRDNMSYIDEMAYASRVNSEVLNRNKRFKNIHKEKRCFVIGNGPSLNIHDLNKITDEITMGCNDLIKLALDNIWKPFYYFYSDSGNLRSWQRQGYQVEDIIGCCKYVFSSIINDTYSEVGLNFDNLYYLYEIKDVGKFKISEDISKCVYSSGTVLFYMIQVALYMGIKEIYLLGVDFEYDTEIHAGRIVKNEGIQNYSNIIDVNTASEDVIFQYDIVLNGYNVLAKYADMHGIKIYNATRGGKLEVFSRVDFDSLF